MTVKNLSPQTLSALRNDLLTRWRLTGRGLEEVQELNVALGFDERDTLIRAYDGTPLVCRHNLLGRQRPVMEEFYPFLKEE